jgi:actin related protein 2/3 complex subunit 5
MSHELHVVARFLHLKTTTMNVNFRKIDVDAYDEDVLLETELYDPDPRGPQQVIDDAKAKAASVRTSLAK